ncbi:hypothetical protein BJX70DRAFT_392669 [Aspergillus crustosus]
MPSQPALPHLLLPYIIPPPHSSLTVLSSVLGATGNWLVLRFLCAALSTSITFNATPAQQGVESEGNKKVVLVSFLRGLEFWRAEAKKLGLDLVRLAEKGQFVFVDGLSELFSPSAPATSPIPSRTCLPSRLQPVIPPAGSGLSRQPNHPSADINGSYSQTAKETGSVRGLHFSGNGAAAIDALEKNITAAVNLLKASAPGKGGDGAEILLVVDHPDLLLAATGLSKGIGATDMGDWIMGLQKIASATLVTIAADSPLIHNASAFAHPHVTPLETEHTAFAIGLAHRAEMIIQLRTLETGAAKDVSGVLRVSKGSAWGQRESTDAEESWDEKEVLYYVQRNGDVSVFGRGQ